MNNVRIFLTLVGAVATIGHTTDANARPRHAPTIVVETTVEPEVHVDSTHSEEVDRHSQSTREVRYTAEPETTPPPSVVTASSEPDRLWHLGVNLGAGPTLGNSSSAELSGSADAYVGLRLGSFALQFEYWLQLRNYFQVGEGLAQGMAMFTLQFWPEDKLWVKGGIGGATLSEDGRSGVTHGSSLMAAVGYDFADTRHFILNVHAKAGSGFYRERGIYSTISGGVGFTWY